MDEKELRLQRIQEFLISEKIKLWLPPFTGEEAATSFQELATKLSNKLKVSFDDALIDLKNLQIKALDNVKDRESYQNTGLACLKILVPKRDTFNVKLPLSATGEVLKEEVSKHFEIPSNRIKLICRGRVIKDNEELEKQNVKHGFQLMCIFTSDPEEMKNSERSHQYLDSMKRDIGLLTGRVNVAGESYLQLTDQSGRIIDIPEDEQSALVLAMALHGKAKTAMKNKCFDQSLLLLLEAEKEFSSCRCELLEKVDNYGLLSLDVAWCYLNLKSLTQLPDADDRLKKCEEVFQKSYGQNLERLAEIKGSVESQRTLFLRLHLLQAIVQFHQGKTEKAREKFAKVEKEFEALKVDDDKLCELIAIGYRMGESRLALRESKGDINLAVTIIENKKAEKKRLDELEKKERQLERNRRKLGKCKDGKWVEPQFHKTLLDMGFSYKTARYALSQTNNRISDAIAFIQEQRDKPPICLWDVDGENLANAGEVELKSRKTFLENKDQPGTSKTLMTREEEEQLFSRVSQDIAVDDEDDNDDLSTEREFFNLYKTLIDANK